MVQAHYIWYPVARIIRDYLIEQSLGVVYESDGITPWPIATQATPKLPVNVITVFDDASTKQYRSHGGGVQENPVIVIEVRHSKHEPGQYQAKKILEGMDALSRWSWTGGSGGSQPADQTVMIATAMRQRGVIPLGVDDNKRWLFNLEYSLVIQSIRE